MFEKKLTLAFSSIRFFAVRFVAKRYILQQKYLKGQIGTRYTLVQLLALYTNPDSHNTQRHRQADGQTT